MPRLIRRQSLANRIKSYLNPLDALLSLSEFIETSDWDQFEKRWAFPFGAALNILFVVARANSHTSGSKAVDDVFGDDRGTPWFCWLASLVIHSLTVFCALNAFYTFSRKRHYRMFESSIDQVPATPSAQRVRVDSSPLASSPLRYVANAISFGSAQSRTHPDAHRDVWELAIWDPLPICLRLFTLFSPGHVLVYWLFLPTQLSDPRPSVTIVTSIFLSALLSAQLSFLCSAFTQKAKDSTLIHKEVLKEYDTKFVHPRTQTLMRDVGTQLSTTEAAHTGPDSKYNSVDTFTPTFMIKRGFKASPNPNYIKHIDPEGQALKHRSFDTQADSPRYNMPVHTPGYQRDNSPSVRSFGGVGSVRQPHFRTTTAGTADGGSLGVYSHANSPLRKSASVNADNRLQNSGDFYYRERGASPLKKQHSPLKRGIMSGSASPTVSKLSHGDMPREARRL